MKRSLNSVTFKTKNKSRDTMNRNIVSHKKSFVNHFAKEKCKFSAKN